MNVYYVGVVFLGTGLAALFALGALVRRPAESGRYELTAFFACLSLFQLHDFLFFSGAFQRWPRFAFYNVPLLFAAGPLVFRYFEILLGRPESPAAAKTPNGGRGRLWRGLHLLPIAAALLALAPYQAGDGAEQRRVLIMAAALEHPPLLRAAYLLALCSILAYGFAIAYRLRYLWLGGPREEGEEGGAGQRRLAFILILFVLAAMLAGAGFLTRELALIGAAGCLVTGILALIYLMNEADPGLMLAVRSLVVRRKYEKSRLHKLDLGVLAGRLDELMLSERVYRRDELNLAGLAELAGIASHQLSQYLNEHHGKNFNAYVNEYRIAEAKQMLLANPEQTVITIAYAVGFNSNSVFHDAFVKYAGESPGRFRKNNIPDV